MEITAMVTVGLALAIWIGLIGFRGQFWRSDQRLETDVADVAIEKLPRVCAVIPARNEADLLPITIRSLLEQDYPGAFTVILVDDHSTDGTAVVAKNAAEASGKLPQLQVISAAPLPAGWTGKLWAMEQGIQAAEAIEPDYILLTDADIEHDPGNVSRLVHKAEQEGLDLASIMVRLRCESVWEKLLIPAFVFFFEKLYPFRWVNDPNRSIAAAAGGCILVRRDVLSEIGRMQAVRQALIDDCALAQAVKLRKPDKPFGKIWLGLSDRTRSLRPYPSLESIWDMVARTAFTQLGYSPWLLLGTLVGMTLIYMVPPLGFALGVAGGNGTIALLGLSGWLLMSLAYFPTARFYNCPPWLAFALPSIALLYTVMTIDSALRHWQGRGGSWKGRVYSHESANK